MATTIEPEAGTIEMAVLGVEGDVKHIWQRGNEDEVEAARAMFDSLKAKGFSAFRVDDEGEKAELMRKFDPKAGKMIMVPQIAGG